MTIDLESEIRDALQARAAQLTPERLRTSTVPRARRRPSYALLVAAAAVLALLAGLMSWVAVRGGTDHGAAKLRAGLIRIWSLEEAGLGSNSYAPAPGAVQLTFAANGRYVATYAHFVRRGTYRVGHDTIAFTPSGRLLGNASSDPILKYVYDAMDALLVGDYTHPIKVAATIDHGELKVRVGDYRIIFDRSCRRPPLPQPRVACF